MSVLNLEKIENKQKLTKEQKVRFNAFYEQYKNELPEGITYSIKTLTLGFTMLIGYEIPEDVEDELITIVQRQIDNLQEFLNTTIETVKEIRKEKSNKNGDDKNDEIL